ncbi:MAG: aminoglycoside phosphotransferase family protein [Prolixibacteraceae bacterium]|nr:aminoglycoside phosphotransferase family protein [Prolixibacteraceae bacterium]MBN2775881.1 aminoglycoside phosphotransferase family protein [Prolixibacteraceae bacterium]
MDSVLKSIVNEFRYQGTVIDINPFGNGHINDTYLVKTIEDVSPDYILQRKNHQVFKNIPGMMENIIRVTDHIRNKLINDNISDIDRKVVHHLKTSDDKFYFKDTTGNYWTLFLFIKGCKSYEKIEKPQQAYLAGKAFGQFQKQISSLPGKPLNETIVDFHNIEFRLNNFQKALLVNFNNRKVEAEDEIVVAQSLSEEMKTLLKLQRQGKIPFRITHNDTKINNILFDKNDNILCVIDLDTVMPGLVHFDFGDAIRTAANTADEDEKDLSRIAVNADIFEEFTKGFLEELRETLTSLEKELLPHSVKFMTYIMGLRFLTDYLDGDTYYKIDYPEHNIVRARAQFKFVSEIEKIMPRLIETVKKYS